MFYSSDLLIFKRGKFSLIWLAATRGEKFLSKKDLKLIDIHFACSEIMEYVMLHQQIKLSLYLSSQLTFGLCVIFHKKIDKLLNELQDLYKKSLIISTHSSDKIKEKRTKHKKEISLNSILDDFDTVNASFGLLNHLDMNLAHHESQLDLTNQAAYLNQARFEDITLMECDMEISTLRNQLENDLEPMNVELLQELLGVTEPNANELETFLNKPFHSEVENVHVDDSLQNHNVDLDRNETVNDVYQNYNYEMNLDFNLEGNANQNSNSITEPIGILDSIKIASKKVKTSCPIQPVEIDQKMLEGTSFNNLSDIRIPSPFPGQNNRNPSKRKLAAKPLIIDSVTTISHQVIRENMNKKRFGLVDKNSIFPNLYVMRSLKSQLACSVNNLLEFPGTYFTLRSAKLLKLWTNRKDMCKKAKSPFIDYDYIPTIEDESKNKAEISDLSIEKFRDTSSFNVNMPFDSFTFGSDTLQRSIRHSSFDTDKAIDENFNFPSEPADVPNNYSVDVSMMPIIEEDANQRNVVCDGSVVHIEPKIAEKGDVWEIIQKLFQNELEQFKSWDDVRLGFSKICPHHASKKTAAMIFLVLLRLGKYKKIKIFQDSPTSEIFIGLPTREI